MKKLLLYIHGKGGSASESERYEPHFPDHDVVGLDYKTFTPWETGAEIHAAVKKLKPEYNHITLIANSIGAFFSMNADIDKWINKAYFISPIVDMEKLIADMMAWANVTESDLQTQGVIHTAFGEDLSWEYLSYVRANPIKWNCPTEILYGERDDLTPLETIQAFAEKHNARLTVMEGGEHWFHTDEQLQFLDKWLLSYSDGYREETYGQEAPEKGGHMIVKQYQPSDYQAVCDFLIALNRDDKTHINWNWARFEWMAEHPEYDKSLSDSIGLWRDGDKVVGAAIYDMYFGEAFCGVLKDYEALYPEILDYAYQNLKDDAGLGIAVCDNSVWEIEALKAAGFSPAEQTENIMRINLDHDLPVKAPKGLSIIELDPKDKIQEIQWLFWQGFDHGSDREEFEREESFTPQMRPHFDPRLSLTAVNEEGEMVAYCCLWYAEHTDYAYVEPVCTIPVWRGKGVAKALLHKALNHAKALGAKQAYVLSDLPFYEKIGFENDLHYTFYWKQ